MTSAVVETKLLTAEEFAKLPSDGKKYELVKGVLVEVCRRKYAHGHIQVKIARYLDVYLDDHPLGHVTAETGYVTATNPDSMRGPDVAFIANECLGNQDPSAYVAVSPDLVVEIASDNDTVKDIQDKIDEYLAAGTRLVWVVYPQNRTVQVHRPDETGALLRATDTLDGEDVLPGFRLPVSDVFKGL